MIGRLKDRFLNFCITQPKKATYSVVAAIVIVLLIGNIWSLYASKRQAEIAHGAELARLEREKIGYSHLAEGEVQMPDIEIGMATDYRIVKQDFENAGFTNIITEPVADLTNTTTKRYNAVIEVTVDGVPRMNVGEWYKVDVPIVITYHTVGDTILTPQEEAYSIAQGLLHGKQD